MRHREEKKKRSFGWFYIVVIIVFVSWILMEDYDGDANQNELIEVPMP